MTIDPVCRSIMCGATALADFQTPVRLTPIISSHWSSVSFQNGAVVQMPALAIRMSSFPNSAMPWATAASSCCWDRTSALIASARLSYASTSLTVSTCGVLTPPASPVYYSVYLFDIMDINVEPLGSVEHFGAYRTQNSPPSPNPP